MYIFKKNFKVTILLSQEIASPSKAPTPCILPTCNPQQAPSSSLLLLFCFFYFYFSPFYFHSLIWLVVGI